MIDGILSCIIFGVFLAIVTDYIFCSYSYILHSKENLFWKSFARECSSVFDFKPSIYLFNGHLQTCFTALRSKCFIEPRSRECLNTSDGGLISLDFFYSDKLSENDNIVVILHGLSGGSKDQYIQSLLLKLPNDVPAVVVHSRGCNNTEIRSPFLTYASFTNDIRHAIHYLHEKIPRASMVLVGYSLGASILTNYLGEESRLTPKFIIGALAVGAPYDLYLSALELEGNWLKRTIYSKNMRIGIDKLFEPVKHIFAGYDLKNVKGTMWEFDDLITSKIAGYQSAEAYYREASASRKLRYVSIPLVCLHAFDDPICPGNFLPVNQFTRNNNIALVFTEKGGHLGWFSGLNGTNDWVGMTASDTILFFFNNSRIARFPYTSPYLKQKLYYVLSFLLLLYYSRFKRKDLKSKGNAVEGINNKIKVKKSIN